MTQRRIAPLLVLLFASLWFVAGTPLAAQSATAAGHASRDFSSPVAEAREVVKAWLAEHDAPGLTIAVMAGGEIVWSQGFGMADLENRVPVRSHTKMRIGSVSKSLTSAAVGLLYEQGKLDLDAAVQKYVPSFPKKRYPITARQLAGHLAGIRGYLPGSRSEVFNMRHYDSVVAGLELFQDDPLLFEPGEKYSYSSHGFNLLSAVVEGASGQDFLSYMQENVFDPLGMENTIADHTDQVIPHRTRFYERDDAGVWENAPYVDNSYKWAGGGFISTAEDLLRFGQGIISGGLLKPKTVELLLTPQRTKDDEPTGYGIGWRSSTDDRGRRRVGHGGGSVGGKARFVIYPDSKVILAMMINTGSLDLGEMPFETASLFVE